MKPTPVGLLNTYISKTTRVTKERAVINSGKHCHNVSVTNNQERGPEVRISPLTAERDKQAYQLAELQCSTSQSCTALTTEIYLVNIIK